MPEQTVKGTAILPVAVYVKAQWDGQGWERLLEKLSPENRRILEGRIIQMSWYPHSVIAELYQTIADLFAGGDVNYCRQVGREAADYGLTFIHRLIFKLQSPSLLVAKGPELWASYYQPSTIEVSEEPRGRIVAVVKGMESTAAHFHSIAGWMERVAELIGGKNVKVTVDFQERRYQITYQ
jgi:hypothetical protein